MNASDECLPVEWCPTRFWGKWADVFLYIVDSRDGLAPFARAETILSLYKRLQTLRMSPSLHVAVYSPGPWYLNELRHTLYRCGKPIAVINVQKELDIDDFFVLPGGFPAKPPAPGFRMRPFNTEDLGRKEKSELNIVRGLARLEIAATKEIASLAGISHTYARNLLPELVERGYVTHRPEGWGRKFLKHSVWRITRSGVQYAHQSWQIPDGMNFRSLRAEQRYSTQRHRRIARLWPAWVKEAYGSDIDIWGAWPEPFLHPGFHPDAMVWGVYQGKETMVWLEVESGKKSRDKTWNDIHLRFKQAHELGEIYKTQMIFVLLSMPWVLKLFDSRQFYKVGLHATFVAENWLHFGLLPEPYFGGFSNLYPGTKYTRIKNLDELKKDPEFFFDPEFRN